MTVESVRSRCNRGNGEFFAERCSKRALAHAKVSLLHFQKSMGLTLCGMGRGTYFILFDFSAGNNPWKYRSRASLEKSRRDGVYSFQIVEEGCEVIIMFDLRGGG
jgi:hypothetical protein